MHRIYISKLHRPIHLHQFNI